MIGQVFGDPVVNFVLFLLLLLPAVQWLTGVLRAISGGQLEWDLLDTFIRSDVAGRVLPLAILIVTGRVVDVAAPESLTIPGLELSMFTGAGVAAAVVYLAIVMKRIIDNVNPTVRDTPPDAE